MSDPRQQPRSTRAERAGAIPGATGVLLAALLASSGCEPRTPTFADDVAAILYESCVSCHRDDGPAPFALIEYEDVRRRADLVASAALDGSMPPWPPARTPYAFDGERRLSGRHVEVLRRWAEAGAPAGDLGRAPSPPVFAGGWGLGEPDLTLVVDEAFPVPARGRDVFRNFVVRIPIDRTRYVRSAELDPGHGHVVHHAVMMVDPTSSSRLAAARDTLPGFDGMMAGVEANTPAGFFLGWAPGRVPTPEPEGLSWAIEPGTDFVIQLHLRPTGEPVTVRPRVGLHFAAGPPNRTPIIVRLSSQTIDIAPGDASYVVEDEFRLPAAVEALGVNPHAHYLGKEALLLAEYPDGRTEPLLHIPEWDFNWQDAYRFAHPVPLPAGTTLRMRWTFDNSADNPRNPNRPPARVSLGWDSSDEMAEMHVQAVPVDEREAGGLRQALTRKGLEDQLTAWRHLLSLDPEDPEAHFGFGSLYQRAGDFGRAEEHYRRALAADPGRVQARYNLGLVLEETGRPAEAERAYAAVVATVPGHAAAHNNLGALLAARGDPAAAERHFRDALGADAAHADARNNLGNALREQGMLGAAASEYARALAARDSFPQARFNLALTLAALGRTDEALEAFAAGARQDPAALSPHLAFAWILATHPSADARRSEEAVRISERALRRIGGPDPLALDVLAAAYASAGRYPDAAAAAERGAREARAAGRVDLADRLLERAEGYRAGRPYLDPTIAR